MHWAVSHLKGFYTDQFIAYVVAYVVYLCPLSILSIWLPGIGFQTKLKSSFSARLIRPTRLCPNTLVCGDRVLGIATIDLRTLNGYNHRPITGNHPIYVATSDL